MTDLIVASRGASQFNLRLPNHTHDEIKAAAAASGRSMNAELLYRLSTWKAPGSAPPQTVGGIDLTETRAALSLVKQLEAAAVSAFEACQLLGIRIEPK